MVSALGAVSQSSQTPCGSDSFLHSSYPLLGRPPPPIGRPRRRAAFGMLRRDRGPVGFFPVMRRAKVQFPVSHPGECRYSLLEASQQLLGTTPMKERKRGVFTVRSVSIGKLYALVISHHSQGGFYFIFLFIFSRLPPRSRKMRSPQISHNPT